MKKYVSRALIAAVMDTNTVPESSAAPPRRRRSAASFTIRATTPRTS